MTKAMRNLIRNMKPEEAVSQQQPQLIHPPTSKRSRDTCTLAQSTYEPRHPAVETQAKRRTRKVPKTPTTTSTTTPDESIDFTPVEETIYYEINGMPHDYEPYPEFQDDPDDDDPLL